EPLNLENPMKRDALFSIVINAMLIVALSVMVCVLTSSTSRAETPSNAPAEKTFDAPHGMRLSVKMIGPVTQTTDLQIICVLKHNSVEGSDKYIEAMNDFNEKLGHLLSSLRERGEFVGEAGETLLFKPPPQSITPKQVLLIGIGDERDLTIEKLKLVGRIA